MPKLTHEQKTKKCIEILKRIDKQLDQLSKYDPYGDMVENFENQLSWDNEKRHTKRLIKLLQKDLRQIKIKVKKMKSICYTARMNSYVHNHNYPVLKMFDKKATSLEYIKRALSIYPYVEIKLTKTRDGTIVKTETWKTVRNKRLGLSIRKV